MLLKDRDVTTATNMDILQKIVVARSKQVSQQKTAEIATDITFFRGLSRKVKSHRLICNSGI